MKKIFSSLVVFIFLSQLSCGADLQVLDIGAGARSIALGRSYSCFKEDSFGLFGNPASMMGIKRLELLSMYGRMNTDVTYSFAGIALPTEYGAFGFGLASNKTSGLSYTTLDAFGRVQPVFDFDFGTDMFIASYQNLLNNQTSYGIRLAYIKTGASAIARAQGRGFKADLGVLYSEENLRLGAVLSNIAPAPSAIQWDTGSSQLLDQTLDIGLSYKVFNVRTYTELPFQNGMPVEPRAGIETSLGKYLDIRGGFELKSRGSLGQYINFSSGIGLNIGNIRADYAYYYNGLLSANSMHFISVSLPIFDPPGIYESLIEPSENFKTASKTIIFKGRVNPRSASVKITKNESKTENGYFECAAQLRYGKNSLELLVLDAKGRIMEKITRRVLRIKTDDTYYLETLGIATPSFYSDNAITRGEIIAFVCRALDIDPPATSKPSYSDIPKTYWPSPYIEYALTSSWIKPSSTKTYKPNDKMSKAEAIRVISLATGIPDTAYKAPEKDSSQGNMLTRMQAYKMISEIPNVKAKVSALLDFSLGY